MVLKAYYDQLLDENLKQMVEYSIKEFGLPVDWNIHLRRSYLPKYSVCWGGLTHKRDGFSIFLSMYRYMKRGKIQNYYEYVEFADDPVIGSIRKISRDGAVVALLAHEVAHCVTMESGSMVAPVNYYMKEYKMSLIEDTTMGGHGPVWQYVYGKLRKKFVNNRYGT